jgi:hypothetical protein
VNADKPNRSQLNADFAAVEDVSMLLMMWMFSHMRCDARLVTERVD